MVGVITDKFNSIILDNNLRVNENDWISFVTTSSESKTGFITKIGGSKKERKFQILPDGAENEEIWSLFSFEKIVEVKGTH
jgi:hypothetical protein